MVQRPKAYSYLRFSTPDQMRGDSYRRQTMAAMQYAEDNGLELDEDLAFHDLGVSAFRGANAIDGALGRFLEAVESGRVPAGSVLLVENLDRLSRDRIMAALSRFTAILERGITIVTLSDGRAYNEDSLNELPELMYSLMVMSRAHEESKVKSQRGRAAWKNKLVRAANGEHVLTRTVPAWLRVNDDGIEVIKERAAIVRRMFELTLMGWGKNRIARQFNAEKVPTFSRAEGWYANYIQKILASEAVIGRFQPMRNVYGEGGKIRVPDGEPIEDYFPAIIEKSDFYRVKHTKSGPSGRPMKLPRNILSGLVFCAKCGGKMHYVNKGPLPKGGEYLACDNARRMKTCDAKSIRYKEVIDHVTHNLPDYRSYYETHVLGKTNGREEIEALSGQIEEVEQIVSRLLDTLERVSSARAEQRLAEYEARLVALKDQKTELEEKALIRETEPYSEPAFIKWYNTPVADDEVEGTMYAAFAHEAAEIRRAIGKIIVEKGKPIEVVPRGA